MRFKDLFVRWIEACIVLMHLSGTTTSTVTPGTNRQLRGRQPQSMDGKKSHRSRIRSGRGGLNSVDVKFIYLM